MAPEDLRRRVVDELSLRRGVSPRRSKLEEVVQEATQDRNPNGEGLARHAVACSRGLSAAATMRARVISAMAASGVACSGGSRQCPALPYRPWLPPAAANSRRRLGHIAGPHVGRRLEVSHVLPCLRARVLAAPDLRPWPLLLLRLLRAGCGVALWVEAEAQRCRHLCRAQAGGRV